MTSIALLATMILTGHAGAATDRQASSKWAAIASDEAARFREATHAPGLAVGLIVDDRVVFAGGFGYRRLGSSEPVTSRTLFHMASVTKPFVSMAILQLVDAGKVALDAPLLRYLPDLKMSDPRLARVTIEQLLAHTSGLPDVEDYRWDHPEYDDGALGRYLRTWKEARLLFEPGERLAYSNLGYEVLAAVIERVSGRPFEMYVQEQILHPLGMHSSTLLLREADPARLARPHETDAKGVVREAPVFPYNRAHAGSSTLYSCIDDMLRWERFNIDNGTLEGVRLLSPQRFADQRTPRARIDDPRLPAGTRMALGLLLFERNGREVIGHGGSDDGFVSLALLVPDRRAGVVAMANLLDDRTQAQLFATVLRILDALLGDEALKPRLQ